jgi:hypothetical protein
MNDLVINISWEYFFGIIGSILAIAYYGSARFTKLETTVQWLADVVRDLTVRAENITSRLFDTGSPVSLTRAGYRHLEQSGFKSYIDRRRVDLLRQLPTGDPLDLYRVQDAAFRMLSSMPLERTFARRLNQFAFDHGISTDLLRRLAAIYLRDVMVGRV